MATMRTPTILLALSLVLTALALAPPAAAQPDPQCMPVYQEHHLGPVTIIRKDSCSAEIIFNGLDPCEDWNPSIC